MSTPNDFKYDPAQFQEQLKKAAKQQAQLDAAKKIVPESTEIAEPAKRVPESILFLSGEDAQTKEDELETLQNLDALTMSQMNRLCQLDKSIEFLVEGFLPRRSIAIMCGDSTVGKSPWAYQLALCIASGRNFFGMSVAQGRVLYLDMENSSDDSKTLRDQLITHLGISGLPDDSFQVRLGQIDEKTIGMPIRRVKPAFVVIDTLRSFGPSISSKNEKSGELMRLLKDLARKYDVTFLIIHHSRKPQKDDNKVIIVRREADDLRAMPVVQWMLQMEGARALVNQSDVRIAVEGGDENPVALRVKWNRRVHGDSSLVQFERVRDDQGEVIGYQKLQGEMFLSAEDKPVFAGLPEYFTFGQVSKALNSKSGSVPTRFIERCIALNLIQRLGGKKGYWKLGPCDAEKRSN